MHGVCGVCAWGRVLSCFSPTQLFATLQTVVRLLCPGILRQNVGRFGALLPPPGDLPDPRIEPLRLLCLLRWQWILYH